MRLSDTQIKASLKELKSWKLQSPRISFDAESTTQESLYKEFRFKDFPSAMIFISKIAKISEKLGHHPDFLLHDWNRLSIWITTHSEKGITELDFNLAREIERIK